MKYLFIFLCIPFFSSAQDSIIPRNANVIMVKGVSFADVCNKVLDAGYVIEKKDNDLQTVKTEPKVYSKSWNAAYKIYVRVKDSTAYFSASFTAPWNQALFGLPKDPLWKDDPAYHHASKKGKTYEKSLAGMPFMWANQIALSFNKPVEYKIQ